jgi:hypothetical protein
LARWISDLLVGEPLGDEPEDLELAVAQQRALGHLEAAAEAVVLYHEIHPVGPVAGTHEHHQGVGVNEVRSRVPIIALTLNLANSTVRNHPAAIYRRVGVHSQAELLALLMRKRTAAGSPPAVTPPGGPRA